MPKKILIINIYGIGDVLFTYPMMRNIKEHDPKVKIGYLCNIRTVSMLKNNQNIDKLFVYEKDEFRKRFKSSKKEGWRYLSGLFHQLKAENYDLVFDISLNSYVSLFCFFLGIPTRVGLDFKKRSRFLTHKVPLYGYEGRHVVEYYLDLLRAVDIPIKDPFMSLDIGKENIDWAKKFLLKEGIKEDKPLIGIVPGGGDSWGKNAKWKRWPLERFAKLADNLIENYSANIILLGGENEIPLCNEMQSLMKKKCLSACGQSTILQFAALANQCNWVVVNDGGPLHIASASGAKTFSLFGPVDEKVYGPYSEEKQVTITSSVFCRPCYRRFRKATCDHCKCLADISVEEVLSKIEANREKI